MKSKLFLLVPLLLVALTGCEDDTTNVTENGGEERYHDGRVIAEKPGHGRVRGHAGRCLPGDDGAGDAAHGGGRRGRAGTAAGAHL